MVTGQVPARPTPRRSDAGRVRLTGRDVTGLLLCAEHYAAPYDLLAAALGVQPPRLRGDTYTYYVCPTKATNPRHAQGHPGHIRAAISETAITTALSGFLDQYALGHDRAAMLTQLIPSTAAQQAEHDQQHAGTLRRNLAQAQAAINGLLTELEQLGDSTSPVDIALRDRIKERFAQRHDQTTAIQAELQAIENAAPVKDNDLTLIDELPYAPGMLAQAPARIRETIAAAFDIQCVYRPDHKQATVVLTITDATPGIITALLTDPRTGNDSDTAAEPFGEIPDGAITPLTRNKSLA